MALASLSGLTYWYPGAAGPALENVALDIDGGLTLITGPSGGGKSTLLRVFNGLVPHFHGGRIAGRANVGDLDVFATPTRLLARSVGFVFQDPELQAVYATVDREVAFGLENLAVPAHKIAGRVADALAAAGVEHLAGRSLRTLSGGERQRVALASTLALEPRIVVLDEPTSQLDAEGAAMVLEAVSRLTSTGRAAILSEHRPVHDAAAHIEVKGGCVSAIVGAGAPRVLTRPRTRSAPLGAEGWAVEHVNAVLGDRQVLDDVSLVGRAGEVVVLQGPNGGGKTTLLRVIAGGLAPVKGVVRRAPGRIAYLPQNPTALLHKPTLREEVALTLDRSGESEAPEEILGRLGLLALSGRYPRDLSTGERQRAALATVLPGRPALVLLDEPTRGMDEAARASLIELIAALRDGGAAIVLATHDADLATAIGDRTVIVANGKALEGAPAVAR